MMYHFYLADWNGDVKPMSAPFLPRVGDTLVIDGKETTITKVSWIGNSKELEEEPIISVIDPNPSQTVYPNHTVSGNLATTIAYAVGPERLIQSIKEYRSATGIGLKEAKDIMQAEYERLGWRTSRHSL